MKWLLTLPLLLSSCGEYPTEPEWIYEDRVPDESREDAASFLLKLCEASNPHSDEEPEDMIREARRAMFELYATPHRRLVRRLHSHAPLSTLHWEPATLEAHRPAQEQTKGEK